jgi:glucan phosphoethanolaminetransferase (alkaline phosphatase superfamily)
MLSSFADWLELNSLPCFYKKFLGIECPGCGMQRAFIELLRGNFIESLKTYPALLPTIFIVLYLMLHLIFKFRKGAEVLKISFIFTASIIVINFIFKLIIH